MSDEHFCRLMEVFVETPQPTPDTMRNLGKELDIDYKKVKHWFMNQRMLQKRRAKKDS